MIKTFEDLFEKIRLAGYDSHRLKSMHEEYRHWKNKYEEDPGTANLSAMIHMEMYRENLQGYLTCLQDVAYICQSEYDQLWSSLELPDNQEEGDTYDQNI